jgi:hypothetical protein
VENRRRFYTNDLLGPVEDPHEHLQQQQQAAAAMHTAFSLVPADERYYKVLKLQKSE